MQQSARTPLASIVRRAAIVTAAFYVIAMPPGPRVLAQQGAAAGPPDRQPIELTIDVAEDLVGRFVPTFVRPEHAQPERGSFYFTGGRVFPEGTIQGDGADFDPNRSGHVGIWIGRGTHLVAASDMASTQTWASTVQLYILRRQGLNEIVSEGVEGAGTVTRIVTGGAGNYAGFIGQQRQTFLGFNRTGGANLRVTFVLHKVVR
jgi:hypothetical protein